MLGTYLLFSIENIVWRETPIASASSCWDILRIARSTRILLFSIAVYFSVNYIEHEFEGDDIDQTKYDRVIKG